jgi:glycosyltransferase involved in cell wall biosynthesis
VARMGTVDRRGVIFDLVAAQSPSYRGRGIARYSVELTRAIVRRHPEIVNSIVVHPELEPPEGIDDLAEWLTTKPDWGSAEAVHLSSAFEPEVPVRVYWPREAASHRLLMSVTLYDLIPDVFPGWYLEDPGLRRRWRCCREVVRTADAVLTPSESAKADTIGLLGVPGHRVSVIGSGTAPAFRPPESRQRAFKLARKGVKGLEEGFIVYNGAFNPRKAVDNLLEGYASLAAELIRRHQLVIVCDAPPLTRNHYLVMAKRLGVEDRLLIPGFVSEEVLVSLYQSTQLAVFPSLYEGYGLPVVESMACRAPTMAGDNSSLQELLPRDARFQPADPGAIAEAITRGLTDVPFRERLLALASQPTPTWDTVADKAVSVFEGLLRKAGSYRPGWRRRPQLALVGLPGALAVALSAYADADEYAFPERSGGPEATAGQTTGGDHETVGADEGPNDEDQEPVEAQRNGALPLSLLRKLDPWRGGYDAIVAWPSGADGRGAEEVEKLATEWPGRVVALWGEQPGSAEGATVPIPGTSTLLVPNKPSNWDETARRVADAAHGRASTGSVDLGPLLL